MANYIKMKDMCSMLGVTPRTIQNYIKNGMPAYKPGKEWLFIEVEVDEWLKRKTSG